MENGDSRVDLGNYLKKDIDRIYEKADKNSVNLAVLGEEVSRLNKGVEGIHAMQEKLYHEFRGMKNGVNKQHKRDIKDKDLEIALGGTHLNGGGSIRITKKAFVTIVISMMVFFVVSFAVVVSLATGRGLTFGYGKAKVEIEGANSDSEASTSNTMDFMPVSDGNN